MKGNIISNYLSFMAKIKLGISNLITYRKLIWGVRPWSTYDGLRLLRFQLQEQLKSCVFDEIHDETKEVALGASIDILERILEDNYYIGLGFEEPKPTLKEIDGVLIENKTNNHPNTDIYIEMVKNDDWELLLGNLKFLYDKKII
jgi:hypothetical protein